MAKKQVEVTKVFCDTPGCTSEAVGPCAICGADVCKEHGWPEGGNYSMSFGGMYFNICPKHQEILSVFPAFKQFNERWRAWYSNNR